MDVNDPLAEYGPAILKTREPWQEGPCPWRPDGMCIGNAPAGCLCSQGRYPSHVQPRGYAERARYPNPMICRSRAPLHWRAHLKADRRWHPEIGRMGKRLSRGIQWELVGEPQDTQADAEEIAIAAALARVGSL